MIDVGGGGKGGEGEGAADLVEGAEERDVHPGGRGDAFCGKAGGGLDADDRLAGLSGEEGECWVAVVVGFSNAL